MSALGFVEAETEHTGRRRRTIYSITERGREALRAWLDQPLTPIALEFEGLLRIFSSRSLLSQPAPAQSTTTQGAG